MKTTLTADHVLIRVYNFEEACRWYVEKLGAVFTGVKWQNDGMDFAYYDIGDFRIELLATHNLSPLKSQRKLLTI